MLLIAIASYSVATVKIFSDKFLPKFSLSLKLLITEIGKKKDIFSMSNSIPIIQHFDLLMHIAQFFI